MLKKAGIAVAIATAGLLALSPVAFAHEQESNQQKLQDNGINQGNKTNNGNKTEACNVSNTLGAECKTKGESVGSDTKQHHKNDN